ncbi:MAG: hypothetical protein ACFCVK_11305 [Acidimicrobiales bacterium]
MPAPSRPDTTHDPAGRPHPHRLDTFRDAIGLSLQLLDEGITGHGAAVVEVDGTIADLVLFADPVLHSPATALDRAYRATVEVPPPVWRPRRVVVLSLEPDRPPLFTGADRRLYRWAVAAFGAGAVLVADWLKTDGDGLGSAAFLWHPRTAWPNDPAPVRLADLAMMRSEAADTARGADTGAGGTPRPAAES